MHKETFDVILQLVNIPANTGDLSDSASIREESSRRMRRERGRKLRRYLLIGLATVGGGTVIGDHQLLKPKNLI